MDILYLIKESFKVKLHVINYPSYVAMTDIIASYIIINENIAMYLIHASLSEGY